MARAFSEGLTAAGDVASMGTVELATRLRARQLSPVDVVDACIRRTEAVNPALNAVVAERFAAARVEARLAEQRYATDSDPPPFLGVPFTVKEAIAVEGMPHTVGSLLRRSVAARADAPAVARLRRAGAIPLGVTNVAECCFWMESNNLVYGRTNNPYDLRCHPGGSSGGEAAIVAAGGSPLGLGSDIGGSIRMPAFFCGLFGLKPSHGQVPYAGHWPVDGALAGTYGAGAFPHATMGPMTRHARDLGAVLAVLTGAAPEPWEAVSFKGRRVFVLADPRIQRAWRATPELADATWRAARHLETLGATLTELDPDVFAHAFSIWATTLAAEPGPHLTELIGMGKRPVLPLEVLRWLGGRPRHSLPALLYLLGEELFRFLPDKPRFVAMGRELEARLGALLGRDALLLMPPHPRVASRHGLQMLRPFDFAFTAIFNVLRLPVAAVPMGLNAEGLPLGVQVVAGNGQDALVLAAASALEDGFGGWVPPPMRA